MTRIARRERKLARRRALVPERGRAREPSVRGALSLRCAARFPRPRIAGCGALFAERARRRRSNFGSCVHRDAARRRSIWSIRARTATRLREGAKVVNGYGWLGHVIRQMFVTHSEMASATTAQSVRTPVSADVSGVVAAAAAAPAACRPATAAPAPTSPCCGFRRAARARPLASIYSFMSLRESMPMPTRERSPRAQASTYTDVLENMNGNSQFYSGRDAHRGIAT